jgi:hypothetical protein
MRFLSAACLAVLLLIVRYQLGCGTSDCHLTKVTVSLDSGAFHHCAGETRVAGRCACCAVQYRGIEPTVVPTQGMDIGVLKQ